MNSPVLGSLQPHVPAMLGVEAGQEQVGLSQGRGGGGGGGGGPLPLCPGTGAGWVGLQRGAETHPDRVGCPVGPGGRRGGGRGEAASSDQNHLVPSTLPPHRLGGVETAAEETVCGIGEDERRVMKHIYIFKTYSVCIRWRKI